MIDKTLTINGPGQNLLTVQRSKEPDTVEFHIFHVAEFVGSTISGLTVLNGSTADSAGGGIFNAGYLTLKGCTISGNATTSDLGGGGVWNNGGDPGAYLTIVNSTISDNAATAGLLGGGGISDGGGVVSIANSAIFGNSAGSHDGGGIYSLGDITIVNSTISGNSADTGTGGGIYFGGNLHLTNSTVAGNSAGDGGGLKSTNARQVLLRNTIIAKNTASTGPDVSGRVNSQGYNLIGDSSGAIISGFLTGNQLNVDPLLGLLQFNGGLTKTHELLAGSPAIDKGHGSNSLTDQRGFIPIFPYYELFHSSGSTKAKCPSELTGKNSVTPWTTASTNTCHSENCCIEPQVATAKAQLRPPA